MVRNYNQDDRTEPPAASQFKHLGTLIDREGGCGAEVAERIGIAWDL